MTDEVNCIFFNDFKCDLGNDTEKCIKGICKDKIKINENEKNK